MKGRLPRLLGVFPDAIVIVDAQGRILRRGRPNSFSNKA